jgi:hypothetical protein
MALNIGGGYAATSDIPAKLTAAGAHGDVVMIDLTNAAGRDGHVAIQIDVSEPESVFTAVGAIIQGKPGDTFVADTEVMIRVLGIHNDVAVETTQAVAIGDYLVPAATDQDYVVTPATQPDFTALTDNSGGTASNTLADVEASYTEATLANNFATLAAKVNDILVHLKSVGIALEADSSGAEVNIKAWLKGT